MADLLTAQQMQKLLHVDRSTIYRMADDGRLPAIKVGRQWRFPATEVAGWLEEQGANVAGDTIAPPAAALPLIDDLPVSCVQIVQDTFADLLGVMLVVTDMEGRPVTAVSNPHGLYRATQPTAQAAWQAQWAALAATLALTPEYVPDAFGLLAIRGVIREGNRLRGIVAIGGIAPAQWPPTPAQIAQIARQLGVSTDVVAQHVGDVFYLEARQQAQVAATVQRIADIIAHILHERRRLVFGAA